MEIENPTDQELQFCRSNHFAEPYDGGDGIYYRAYFMRDNTPCYEVHFVSNY